MRCLKSGIEHETEVCIIDEPGKGGACHEYRIQRKGNGESGLCGEFGVISFQNGPIKEKGVNGCQQEDLLAIVIDRLRSFQAGLFSCSENAIALTKVEEALHWLNHRTMDRIDRDVEGMNKL